MKNRLTKKSFWQSLLSFIVLGVFILLAVKSIFPFGLDIPETKTIKLADGSYEETFFTVTQKRTTTGFKDKYNNWTGDVTVKWTGGSYGYTEKCTMIEGRRWGMSTHIYPWGFANSPGGHYTEYYVYIDGMRVSRLKDANSMTDSSAFQVLGNKYPWFLFSLNAFGFDSLYVEAYMDTVETILYEQEFKAEEFDNYYGDVLDILGDTPYDSIITFNSNLTFYQGLDEMKNSELRMAIIDRYRAAGNSTYDIINTTYPGYLQALNDTGVVNQDFKIFCQQMDSCMTSYGILSPEDPFFIDSVDARIYRALITILDTEESTKSSVMFVIKSAVKVNEKNNLRDKLNEVKSFLNPLSLKSSPSEVGQVVLTFMLMQYIEADILRKSFMESCYIKKSTIRKPTVATEFESNTERTTVTLIGHIMDDGGAAVTSRGIAWATFYNPSLKDNTQTSGKGTGDFTVKLEGLKAGTMYYARTYATNSVGTTYGNCISFIAGSPVGIGEFNMNTPDFSIYPNPATNKISIETKSNLQGETTICIFNMNGALLQQEKFQSQNLIELDVSALAKGFYLVEIQTKKGIETKKLVVQ
jgi:hypothetical protein